MTPDEIPALLKRVSYADSRFLPEDPYEVAGMAALWADILRAVPADYAMQAVAEHYAMSPYPIKPSDISTRWRATVRERLGRHTGTFEPQQHPNVDPDDPNAYIAALRAEQHAVATGRRAPTESRSLTTSVTVNDVAAMRQQRDLAAFIKQTNADAKLRCDERIRLIRRHPDLSTEVARILDRPIETWNGYVTPEHDALGRINTAPEHRGLTDVLADAEIRVRPEHPTNN